MARRSLRSGSPRKGAVSLAGDGIEILVIGADVQRFVPAKSSPMLCVMLTPSMVGPGVREPPDIRRPSSGDFSVARIRLAARQTLCSERSIKCERNSSGCCASMPYGFSAESGKCRVFAVTTTSAPHAIAAASTWRSFWSGNVSAGIKPPYPVTRQSRTLVSIRSRVLASLSAVTLSLFAKTFLIHSSWISAVHLARNSPVVASSTKRSRSGAG